MPEATERSGQLDADGHRRLGIDLFNRTWELIEATDRTPAQVDEMIHAAHASRYHWSLVGTLANAARGEWQISRVYSTLGRGEPALWHARRCAVLADAAMAAGVAEDWDLPAALEGLARAQAVAGDHDGALRTLERARKTLAAVADPEDREQIQGDIDTIPLSDPR